MTKIGCPDNMKVAEWLSDFVRSVNEKRKHQPILYFNVLFWLGSENILKTY